VSVARVRPPLQGGKPAKHRDSGRRAKRADPES